MGSDDLFKKKRKRLDERKKEYKTPKPDSFLIVTEGTKTEPLYFDGLAKHINDTYGQSIDVRKPYIDTQGIGMGTTKLVEETARIVARAPIVYSQIWVVFDKDDFTDFDAAIIQCANQNYQAAWSNQAFEYWIYLHFNFSDAALHRDDWCKKLSEIFKDQGINPKGYEKNDSDIFDIVTSKGSLAFAVNNASRIAAKYKNTKPSQCDPCTMVHQLILELRPWLNDLFNN